MKRATRLLVLLALCAAPVWAQFPALAPLPQLPENEPASLSPRVQDFLKENGRAYGLSITPQGRVAYAKANPETGRPEVQTLSPELSQRMLRMLAKLPPQDFDAAMAQSLRSYLSPRSSGSDMAARLFERDPRGRERLTPMGRNLLMDILTAEDGRGFKIPPSPPSASKSLKRDFSELRGASLLGSSGPIFDGTGPAFQLEGFDWAAVGAAGRDLRGLKNLKDYAVDERRGTIRLMIEAPRPVPSDHLTVKDPAAEAPRIYREAGLDPALFARHNARLVRAMDNLVAVDVPLPQAAALGGELAGSGVASRPARVLRAAGAAAVNALAHPAWVDPLYSILPIPALDVRAQNERSRDLLGIAGLWKRGMMGEGSVVGVIDSGLDLKHPDFQGRVAAIIDLTGTGLKDTVGHGTHVAGSIGGDGAASQGRYKGMAPGAKFVILKVFGDEGSASEDTIVAAMKAAGSLPSPLRPQVINMSLGGPGDPDSGPLSQMANELMVKDNIVVAVAAGNSGPSGSTVDSPGNARYVMTVTGVNKERQFPFFASRGPVTASDGRVYNKPDLATVAGDVSAAARRQAFWKQISSPLTGSGKLGLFPQAPRDPSCYYGPGVISAGSSDDPDTDCLLAGNPMYRYMSGTSMATPMAAGIAADVVGYLNQNHQAYKAAEVKALMMETATDLHQPSEVQGAGLVNGEKLGAVLAERVRRGLPVGNIAFMYSQQLSRWDQFNMRQDARFVKTDLGILDTRTQHLINNDVDFDRALKTTDEHYKHLPWYAQVLREVNYWLHG